MDKNSALSLFPKTRLKPYDGMAVTADVWAQAHEEHRKARQSHDALFHRPGILTGLEAQANDPPDQYVFISPGAAVDSAGNVIILNEAVAYDFGAKAEGLLYLLLGHGERESGGADSETRQIHHEFVIAARSSLPKRPTVELARVRIHPTDKTIRNPANAAHPALGELDLRFRIQAGPPARQQVHIGLCAFGRAVEEIRAGWQFLAAECERASSYRLIVDDNLPISAELTTFQLVYLSAKGAFLPNEAEVKSLQEYLKQGKILFVEALNEEAGKSFSALLEQLGQKTAPPAANASLLEIPFLFAEPPPGAHTGSLQVGKQVIFSASGYSLAWAGKLPGEARSRNHIRNAHEWGINLIHYCLTNTSP